jgi:hypothetical protein
VALSPNERLRRMVGERIPPGGDETNTLFLEEEITDLIAAANDDLNVAALAGWYAKMAEFAKLVDAAESGTEKKLSQMFKNAEMMVKHFEEVTGLTAEAIAGRVVGRAVNLREDCRRRRPSALSGAVDGGMP